MSGRRSASTLVGELLVTFGLVVLLFAVYELWVTGWETDREQQRATRDLQSTWSEPRSVPSVPAVGQPFTRLYIPRFGPDYGFTVLEGVSLRVLAKGPGHYPGSALPGDPGNFAVAGHRIGRGAPFNDLDELQACDAIIVETRDEFMVYRVLPMSNQVATWSTQASGDQRCHNVPVLGGPYESVAGIRIVAPTQVDAVNPVPYRTRDAVAQSQQDRLLTLTTCNPEFDNTQRLIVHAILTDRAKKTDGLSYAGLLKQLEKTL
ncbi:class E sortase [Amycolatopsis sp. SID8362]|nr:class E sortase [Amycolatopsis sp. SID8362]NED47081.1 class E sortase [Amycolatopsis sp. SID8362]